MTPEMSRFVFWLVVTLVLTIGLAVYLYWETVQLRGDVEARDDEIRLLEDWIDARDRAERVRGKQPCTTRSARQAS